MNRTNVAIVIGLVVSCLATARAEADAAALFTSPSALRLVGTPRAGERLPVVVFLSATNGLSEDMFQRSVDALPFDRFVAVLPPGRPSSSDYLPDFSGFVSAIDARLTADLATAREQYAVDAERIYLIGFSLGGDTGYALLMRHPEVYRGAVVVGSRSSAQPRGRALETLRTRDVRVAFAIGSDDDAVRVQGMTRAYDTLRGARVATTMLRFPGAHSLPEDVATLRALCTFAFGTQAP